MGGGRGKEGARERQDLEALVEGDDAGGLTESDVSDEAGGAENGNPTAAALGEGENGVGNVGGGGDFENVGLKGVGSDFGDENRWLRLVFGASWPASWPPLGFNSIPIFIILSTMLLLCFLKFKWCGWKIPNSTPIRHIQRNGEVGLG